MKFWGGFVEIFDGRSAGEAFLLDDIVGGVGWMEGLFLDDKWDCIG